jgi:hypothetical protein
VGLLKDAPGVEVRFGIYYKDEFGRRAQPFLQQILNFRLENDETRAASRIRERADPLFRGRLWYCLKASIYPHRTQQSRKHCKA